MSQLVQQRAEETHTRILSSAERCFARSGYDAASVADICELAGVTKGAFYYHFETKQALFLELLNSWLIGLEQHLKNARSGATSIPEGLIDMAGSTRIIFSESSNYLPMFLEFWLQAVRDPKIWELVIEPYRRYQNYFTIMLQEGIREGSLRDINPDLAGRALIAMAIGLVLQGLMDPQGADWANTAQDSIQILLQGLEN